MLRMCDRVEPVGAPQAVWRAVGDKVVGNGQPYAGLKPSPPTVNEILAVDATGSIDLSGSGLGAFLNLNPVGTIIATERLSYSIQMSAMAKLQKFEPALEQTMMRTATSLA